MCVRVKWCFSTSHVIPSLRQLVAHRRSHTSRWKWSGKKEPRWTTLSQSNFVSIIREYIETEHHSTTVETSEKRNRRRIYMRCKDDNKRSDSRCRSSETRSSRDQSNHSDTDTDTVTVTVTVTATESKTTLDSRTVQHDICACSIQTYVRMLQVTQISDFTKSALCQDQGVKYMLALLDGVRFSLFRIFFFFFYFFVVRNADWAHNAIRSSTHDISAYMWVMTVFSTAQYSAENPYSVVTSSILTHWLTHLPR